MSITIPTLLRTPLALAVTALATGCAHLPAYEHDTPPRDSAAPSAPRDGSPDMHDVIQHVECELLQAVLAAKPVAQGGQGQSNLARLATDQYVAYVTLTLDVVESEGAHPSLAAVTPFAGDGLSRSLGVGARLSQERHRNMTQSFMLRLDPTRAVLPLKEACQAHGSRLRGTLDLADVIAEGLRSTRKEDFTLPLVDDSKSIQDDVAAGGLAQSPLPTFGSTVEFTVVHGIDVDPVWTLRRFVGPGGGSDPLLAHDRTLKDTLVISFGSSTQGGETGDAAAVRGAMLQQTLQILNTLRVPRLRN